MTEESFEFENVRIGNWQGRLPSQICTDRDIFNEIFSLETWDKVLNPAQKERILRMLPPEVLATPGAAEQTMEDLLAKTLNRFDSNPLENLFNQLEVGQLDPDVVVTKAAIRKEWRKESIRKRKKYHTKLLEEIVVSREKHLRAVENCSNSFTISNSSCKSIQTSKLEKFANHVSSDLEPDSVYMNDVNKSAPIGRKNSISPNIKEEIMPTNNHIMKRVHARVKEQLKIINQQTGCLSSSDDESPVIKKPSTIKATTKTSKSSTTSKQKATKSESLSKPATVPSTSIISNRTVNSLSTTAPINKTVNSNAAINSSSPLAQSLSQNPQPHSIVVNSLVKPSPVPVPLIPSTISSIRTTFQKEEQTAAKLAKFPKILPAPFTISSTMTSSTVSDTPTISNQNHLPLTPSLVQIQPSITTTSQQSMSNPSKSSPILASQLQAPAMSTISNYNAHNSISKMPIPPRKFSSIMNFNTHSKLSDKSSEDDLESSSDEFEFETLNPSMLFSTSNNFSSNSKKSTTSVNKNKTINPTHQINKSSTLSSALNAKPKTGVAAVSTFNMINKITTSSVALTTTTGAKNVPSNAKVLQPHQQQIVKATPKTASSPGINSTMASNKNSTPFASCTPNTLTNSTIAPNLLPSSVINPAALTSQKITPNMTVGVPQNSSSQLHQTKIVLSTNLGALCSDNGQTSTATTGNSINSSLVNSLASIPVTANHQIQSMSSGIPLSSISLNLLSGTDLQNIHDQQQHVIQNSNSLVDSDDLNLNNLGLGLGMGMSMNLNSLDGDADVLDDVDAHNSKLVMDGMDKMDDLSVLDGNPFDSIPNLSDELDGLDLDMVDGLCDFDGLLSEEKQYASFFSLIRDVLCSTRDHRMTLICLEKTIRKWSCNPSAALNLWFMKVNDWNEALITALNFLAGNYQDVHPEEFVPYIEYKYKTKYYQWIGAGRDGDNNLTPLCALWMDNLERLPPLKKLEGDNDEQDEDDDDDNDSDGPNEDAKKKNKRPITPPPPRCVTDWTVRPSTQEEKEDFQVQERGRFDNPHKAFTYRMHGYESVVGPVKGVYSSQSGMTNKARGHSLLVDDRPPYVTILALVRDAVARLPNGEGTRSEICEMLRDSAFLAAEASNVTLNSVVSGALDRLHYERDPCVRYDSHKKSWIYLHRDRTQEQFERLHHNRSYTKSTKSRNNTSRKSRKAANKSSNILSNSLNDGSNITSISGTSSTPEKTVTKGVPSVGTPSATSTPIQTTKIQNGSNVTVAGKLVATQTLSAGNSSQNNTLTLSAATNHPGGTTTLQDAPTIRFAIPGTSSTTTIGGQQFTTNGPNSISNEQQTLILQAKHSNQSTGSVNSNTVNNIAMTTVQNQVPIQIQSQAPLQVQNTGNTNNATLTINNTGGNNLITVSSSSPTATSTTFTPGQLVFGPQALLRLAGSLRLPEGVRFTQLRVPGGVQGTVGTSPLRLPQHRILLTRGGIPGSTQGVLLQTVTSTGQTVLLSTTPGALGNLQGTSTQLTPISIQSNTPSVETLTNNIQHAQPAQNINILNSNSHNVNVVTTTSLNSLSGSTVAVSQGINSTHLTVPGLETGGGTTTISLPASLLANNNTLTNHHHHQSLVTTGGGSNHTLMTSTGTPFQALTVAQQTQNMVSQVQAQLQQQQNAGGPQTAQLTSPIIIRSNQGDFVIPGHISLGRGMQGIKVIPMPTGGGKQTVIARIVTPTTTAANNPINPTSNTQS